MKLSQIILEEYQGKLEIYLEAKKNYREAYELDPNEINELIHFDTIAKQQEGFFAKITQAYKDALYMEGEIEKANKSDSVLQECAEEWDKACNINQSNNKGVFK